MNDATRGAGDRKGGWRRLTVAVNRWFWRRSNDFARKQGWEVDRSAWGGRKYRDPRFEQRKKEILESPPQDEPVSEPPPRKFSPGDGFPRKHPKIARARGPVAAAGLAWRWRTELALAGAASVVLWQGPVAALLLAGAVLAGGAIPAVRRAVGRLVIRHRFQGLCLRTSMRTPEGRLPLVVHTQAIPDGTAMLIWCRSGMSPELFEDYIPEIKVACFVKEVTLHRHPRHAHLLTIELRRA
ncbi:hypothetical protein [Nonomuraea gerenzanensis]|uniref:Uncharacterized protein n=1 Tax=Nonomuraea gerenzanensis TaxID=93944 RepID=A0A1M4DYG6_9ACTN|nr:hypothetical protein [Nonomuraea gerenzanensis]UBU13893.1 hypothetical protein LCN96_02320 [Nonomuraea gerenzanensis]SBO91572.1 hypothetical protein BN4615_P1086 [Nonomuraea gerenzanensis]